MHPQHFLPRGAGLLFQGGQDVVPYVAAPDGVLRIGGEDTGDRFPSFDGPNARATKKRLNPFLVVINADMAFRRFRRQPHPLCDEDSELMDLTISLVEKIYFQPIIDRIKKRMKTPLRSAQDADGDVEMGGVDEFGAEAGDEKDKTITQKNVHRSSRMGKPVKRPAPGAPHEKFIEYYQYLMSGQGMYMSTRFLSFMVLHSLLDHDLTREDEDLLAELDLDSKSECSEDEDSGDGTSVFCLH